MAIIEARPALTPRARPAPRPLELRLALAGALVCASSVAMAAAGASADAAFGRGLLQLLIVGGPIAVGLYALRSPANRSFGIALLGVGFAWSLTAFAESPDSVPFTVGRLATWLTFPGVVYLLLTFPHGRIATGLDRAIFICVVGVMVILFYGTAPFVQAFPAKTLWSTCTTCPANALLLVSEQPAFLKNVVYVREWLVELLWVAIAYSMYRRYRAASPLQREAMGPAFIAGTLLGLSHYAHITARQLDVATDTVIALSSVWTFCIVAVCAAFLFGLVRRRIVLARALAQLGVAVRTCDDRAPMRDALASALGDRTLRLLYRDPDSSDWHDERGRTVPFPPETGPDRAVTTVGTDDGRHDVALIHDVALFDDPELLDGVTGILLAGWRHQQLTGDLGRALTDLEDSRHRIAQAADRERARIERDLHDGAQQRLITLRIRLSLAADLLNTNAATGIRQIHDLGAEIDLALDDLRALSHGVYPPLLTDRGLTDALHSVAAQAPMPVHLTAVSVTRHPVEVEAAVYLTCLEALQNALRHARGATAVWITLTQGPTRLTLEIRDDGPGFTAHEHDGHGLRNMADRIEAIGGELTISAPLGQGTRVVGSVPLASNR
jgi:signal transduction histidine kinase